MEKGQCLVWDVTCPDTLVPSHLNIAVSDPGAVATTAESNSCVGSSDDYYYAFAVQELSLINFNFIVLNFTVVCNCIVVVFFRLLQQFVCFILN